MRAFHKAFVSIVALAVFSAPKARPLKEFRNWPPGTSPTEVGKRVAERFAATPHTNFGRSAPPDHITYPESVAWYGALTFAQLSGDKDLSSHLIQRFGPMFSEESKLVPDPNHVDSTVFGSVPLEIYIETKDRRYLDLGQRLADKQWETPTADGLTNQTRYWIDDMYMITAVQVQAYRATSDSKYLDRAALEMVTYLQKLQQPNGLFYHAPDVPFSGVAATVGWLLAWRRSSARYRPIILSEPRSWMVIRP